MRSMALLKDAFWNAKFSPRRLDVPSSRTLRLAPRCAPKSRIYNGVGVVKTFWATPLRPQTYKTSLCHLLMPELPGGDTSSGRSEHACEKYKGQGRASHSGFQRMTLALHTNRTRCGFQFSS